MEVSATPGDRLSAAVKEAGLPGTGRPRPVAAWRPKPGLASFGAVGMRPGCLGPEDALGAESGMPLAAWIGRAWAPRGNKETLRKAIEKARGERSMNKAYQPKQCDDCYRHFGACLLFSSKSGADLSFLFTQRPRGVAWGLREAAATARAPRRLALIYGVVLIDLLLQSVPMSRRLKGGRERPET